MMYLWVNLVNLSVIYQLNHSLNNGIQLIQYLLLYIGTTEFWYWFVPFWEWILLGKSSKHVVLSLFTIKLLHEIKSKSKSVSFQLISMLYLEYLLIGLNFFVWVYRYVGYWIFFTEITNEIQNSSFIWGIINSAIQLSLLKVYIITVHFSGDGPNGTSSRNARVNMQKVRTSHQIHDSDQIKEVV